LYSAESHTKRYRDKEAKGHNGLFHAGIQSYIHDFRCRVLLDSPSSRHTSTANMSSKVTFQDTWLQKPEFQPWLTREEGDSKRAYCKICKSGFGTEISTIRRHKKAKMHVANEGKADQQESGPSTPNYSLSGVAFATILLCCFIAEHNLPFTIAEPLVKLQKRMFPDSTIAQE
ncbi:hypothetical protein Hamer_G026680, partial [Homarus americanus]